MTGNLTERQAALHFELSRKSEILANMYLGALIALKNTDNTDCLAQAAHSVRELMEKLPEIISVSVPEEKASLTKKDLETQWQFLLKETRCRTSGEWSGDIDGSLKKFLEIVEIYLGESNHIPRSEQVRQFFREFDGEGRILPSDFERENMRSWIMLRDFFVAVAHHRKSVVYQEFFSMISSFEEFILEKFYPKTTADFDDIDKLIKEGETT